MKQVVLEVKGKALTAEGHTFFDEERQLWLTVSKVHWFQADNESGYSSQLYCNPARPRAIAIAQRENALLQAKVAR